MPKLQVKKTHSGKYVSYFVNLPKILVENVLKWRPGDNLVVEYIERDGKRGVFIYKR